MEYLANDNRISVQHRKIFWIVWIYQFSMLIYIFSDLKTIACAATGKQVSNRKQSREKLFADYVKKFSILTYDVSQIYDSTVIHYDYPMFEDLHDVFADLKRAYCWTWTFTSNRCRIQKMLSFWGGSVVLNNVLGFEEGSVKFKRNFANEWHVCQNKALLMKRCLVFLLTIRKKPGINLTLKISKRLGIQGSNL